MKKLSLFGTFVLLVLGASAQNFALTSKFTEGDLVDGQTIECPYTQEYEFDDPAYYMAGYQWNPHFTARSLTGEPINIQVTATSSIAAQLCWPAGCQAISPGGCVSAYGSISADGSDLMFDAPAGEVIAESKPIEPFVCNPGGTGAITITSGDQTMTVYVNWIEELEGANQKPNNFALTCKYAEGDLKNGQTIEVPYVKEYEFLPEETGVYMAGYQWNPHFMARSLTGEDVNITVTVESSIAAQLCWPNGCTAVMPGAKVSASGSVSCEGSDLMFDAPAGEVFSETKPIEPFVSNPGGTGKLIITSGEQSMVVYVKWIEQLEGQQPAEELFALTSKYYEGDLVDGQIIECPYVQEYEFEGSDYYMAGYQWDPQFKARSLTGEEVTITVTAESSIAAQLCWPSGCSAIVPGGSVTSTGRVFPSGSDLRFDAFAGDIVAESKPTEPFVCNPGGMGKLTVTSGGQTMTVYVKWIERMEGQEWTGDVFALTSKFAEDDLVDGQTIDCPYSLEYEFLPEEAGAYLAGYQWNPQFIARSLTGETVNISVTATSSIAAQLCWPAGCMAIYPGASVSATGYILPDGSNLFFDAPAGDVVAESKPTEPFVSKPGGTGEITITAGDQTMTVYINWLEQLEGAIEVSVGGIEAEDMAPRYYTLQGVEVASPERGLYIVKRGNKVSKQIFK